jgi:Icc-related predicted phosphoesterase
MATMTRILAIADETSPALSARKIRDIAPDLVVSCGDLPFSYLDYVASAANKPLVFVPGNHDPSLKPDPYVLGTATRFRVDWNEQRGPIGGTNLDGQIVEDSGLTLAGLGGSIRYRPGDNQYSEGEMRLRVAQLEAKWWLRRMRRRRRVDVLVTHSPPRDLGDMPDAAHQGFTSFRGLIERMRPQIVLHGHIHPHGFDKPDRVHASSKIINVVPYRVVEVPP